MAATRIEKDSMGQIEVPADQLWGSSNAAFSRTLPYFSRKKCLLH